MDTYVFEPIGVCSKMIEVKIDNDTIMDVSFFGGCNGNLKGISALARGQKLDDVINRLKGIPCGAKSTSCPDQFAKCLLSYKKEKAENKEIV